MKTWLEFAQVYEPTINNEMVTYLLWNETAYPFGNLKIHTSQLRRAIRAHKNRIDTCEMCGHKSPYHRKGCFCSKK